MKFKSTSTLVAQVKLQACLTFLVINWIIAVEDLSSLSMILFVHTANSMEDHPPTNEF